jgi:hypothetical protein
MTKKKVQYLLIAICGLLISLVPLIFYILKMSTNSLSNDLNVWNLFGQYIGGTVGPIISILTLAVTAWIAIEFNDYQKRQTAIQLFKEFRTTELLTARNKAWEVKVHWNDLSKTIYKDEFIEALILEKPRTVNGTEITICQIKGVYDLFAFYTMLSTYKNQSSTLRQLNYFYYSWWRKFLYEVAVKYDSSKIADLNSKLKTIKGFNSEVFFNSIKLTPKLNALDEVCGFDKLFENESPYNIYVKNS